MVTTTANKICIVCIDATLRYRLAAMYIHGQGVTQSFEKAIEFSTRAANQKHAGAQCNLGLMYGRGDGVGQSVELARVL